MSSPNIDLMREKITKAYGGDIWADRVKRMPDRQVMAIYYRILETTPDILEKGRFAYEPDKNKKEEFHQISIFEYNLERRLENERKGSVEWYDE